MCVKRVSAPFSERRSKTRNAAEYLREAREAACCAEALKSLRAREDRFGGEAPPELPHLLSVEVAARSIPSGLKYSPSIGCNVLIRPCPAKFEL
ncbi:Hypothetical protein NTJ_03844 [Nesidiocoris tenuis]|uniref:Uncharacterized protein n=1 Tax=Nesidiocoris tenuis TaxID=355587 RepID=A0ABN7AJH6_9HEMI|nr:Hypothetical protein NTJ_03844 [Nesidiocoris tenuis]